jgi:chemotaxis protein histidine kinase CheA
MLLLTSALLLSVPAYAGDATWWRLTRADPSDREASQCERASESPASAYETYKRMANLGDNLADLATLFGIGTSSPATAFDTLRIADHGDEIDLAVTASGNDYGIRYFRTEQSCGDAAAPILAKREADERALDKYRSPDELKPLVQKAEAEAKAASDERVAAEAALAKAKHAKEMAAADRAAADKARAEAKTYADDLAEAEKARNAANDAKVKAKAEADAAAEMRRQADQINADAEGEATRAKNEADDTAASAAKADKVRQEAEAETARIQNEREARAKAEAEQAKAEVELAHEQAKRDEEARAAQAKADADAEAKRRATIAQFVAVIQPLVDGWHNTCEAATRGERQYCDTRFDTELRKRGCGPIGSDTMDGYSCGIPGVMKTGVYAKDSIYVWPSANAEFGSDCVGPHTYASTDAAYKAQNACHDARRAKAGAKADADRLTPSPLTGQPKALTFDGPAVAAPAPASVEAAPSVASTAPAAKPRGGGLLCSIRDIANNDLVYGFANSTTGPVGGTLVETVFEKNGTNLAAPSVRKVWTWTSHPDNVVIVSNDTPDWSISINGIVASLIHNNRIVGNGSCSRRPVEDLVNR